MILNALRADLSALIGFGSLWGSIWMTAWWNRLADSLDSVTSGASAVIGEELATWYLVVRLDTYKIKHTLLLSQMLPTPIWILPRLSVMIVSLFIWPVLLILQWDQWNHKCKERRRHFNASVPKPHQLLQGERPFHSLHPLLCPFWWQGQFLGDLSALYLPLRIHTL